MEGAEIVLDKAIANAKRSISLKEDIDFALGMSCHAMVRKSCSLRGYAEGVYLTLDTLKYQSEKMDTLKDLLANS